MTKPTPQLDAAIAARNAAQIKYDLATAALDAAKDQWGRDRTPETVIRRRDDALAELVAADEALNTLIAQNAASDSSGDR